jgi:hypothetical protein
LAGLNAIFQHSSPEDIFRLAIITSNIHYNWIFMLPFPILFNLASSFSSTACAYYIFYYPHDLSPIKRQHHAKKNQGKIVNAGIHKAIPAPKKTTPGNPPSNSTFWAV